MRRGIQFSSMWLGWALACFAQSFIQDLIGKEKYLATISSAWVNTPVWIWPVFATVACVAVEIVERKAFDDRLGIKLEGERILKKMYERAN